MTKTTLPAYRITYTNGQQIVTSMAAGVTLEEAKAYYIGHEFNLGEVDQDNMQTAVAVEQVQ